MYPEMTERQIRYVCDKISEFRRQETGDRSQESGDRSQESEFRRQNLGDRR